MKICTELAGIIGFILLLFTGCKEPTGYLKEDGQVYYAYYTSSRFGLSRTYHRDSVRGVDYDTFISVAPDMGKDRYRVYLHAYALKQIDVETFVMLPGEYYFKDKDSVYVRSGAIPTADVATFVMLDDYKAKDAFHLYEQGEIARKQPVDIRSYTLSSVNRDYGQDKYHYYHRENQLDVDYDSFEVLTQGYSLDKKRVYFYNTPGAGYWIGSDEIGIVTGADPITFKVLDQYSWGVGQDKQHYYIGRKQASEKEVRNSPKSRKESN